MSDEEPDRYARATWLSRHRDRRPRPGRTPSPPSPPDEFEGVLVSGVEGEIAQLGVALPDDLFVQPAIPADAALLKLTLDTFAAIVSTMPKTCEVVAVSDAPAKAKWFLDSMRPGLSNQAIDATGVDHTPWLQDPFCTVHVNGERRFVKPSWSDSQVDLLMCDRLAQQLPVPVLQGDDVFEGGNVLAGTEHWFLGADEAAAITTTGDVAAVEARYREIGGGRKLVLVRSKIAVPDEVTQMRVSADPGPPDEVFHKWNDNSQQPIYHIDMFMTVAIDADGREVVLLASPKAAAKIMGGARWPAAAALDAQLESVKEVLLEQVPHLRIIDLPTPLFAVDTDTKRRWRYASYANVLLQRDQAGNRTVWLPQFQGSGEHEWKEVQGVDAKVREIYEELGYDVIPLPDCRAFSYHMGGPHCAFHYLARK